MNANRKPVAKRLDRLCCLALNLTGMWRRCGIASILALAVSGSPASATQAATVFHSDSSNEKTVITATDHEFFTDKFVFGEAAVACFSTNLEGTQAGTKFSSITLVATYSGCTLGETPAAIQMNHCAYVLSAETSVEGHGKVELECAKEQFVEVEISGFCTIKIGPQTFSKGITYTNVQTLGNPRELTAHVTATGIKVASKSGPFCFLVGSSGTYSGTETVKGFKNEGSEGVGTAKTTPTVYFEGPQVGLKKE